MAELESEFLNLEKQYQKFAYEDVSQKKDNQRMQDDEDKLHNNYLFVQEQDQLLNDVTNLCNFFQKRYVEQDVSQNKFPLTSVKQRINYVIQKYQEQANLLDPLIPNMIPPLMEQVKSYLRLFMEKRFAIDQDFHNLLQIVYTLCKTRGYKAIVEFFPHEVKDLEPTIFYLKDQQKQDNQRWETKYVLLLWLSIIILVPFDLDTIDSGKQDQTIFEQLLEISKIYLNSATLTREAAAIFLAKYLCRPDIQKKNVLPDYLNWALSLSFKDNSDPLINFFISGKFYSLVEILKAGQREELLPHVPLFMKFMESEKQDQAVDRLYKVKLACRIGMVYLKPRQTLWAYKKQVKTLNQNFDQSKSKLQVNYQVQTQSKKRKISQTMLDDLVYFQDINLDNLEDIIEFLLQNLSDKDTVVRWAAAKGIGRITSRLDLNMADDIVNALFQILNFDKNENSWHGCCLTLAELSRRGLLLPNRLDQAFKYLYEALDFDQNQGNFNSGANVRDSACYVAWAFARAYDPTVLKDYQVNLAKALLKVTLYDREINCRRAASAAFQEHVGRQGTFPHGIEILTEADYFTVGFAYNSYINVGLYVSSFDVYFSEFVNHLATNRVCHTDINLRLRAAAALGVMVPLNPQHMIDTALPLLIKQAHMDVMQVRHGTLYAIAEILLGLVGQSHEHMGQQKIRDGVFWESLSKNEQKLVEAGEYRQKFNTFYDSVKFKDNLHLVNDTLKKDIFNLLVSVVDHQWLRGKSGDILRLAICRLITCLSSCKFELGSYEQVMKDILDGCVVHQNIEIQEKAKQAIKVYSATYHSEINQRSIEWVQKLIKQADLQLNHETQVRGSTLAIGTLSSKLQMHFLKEILEIFEKNTTLGQKKNDPETRQYTLQSLTCMVENTPIAQIPSDCFERMLAILFKCMKDYTLDNRGDIGSIVRESSMFALNSISQTIFEQEKNFFNNEFIQKILNVYLQQLMEKIDRSRLVAGVCLQQVYNKILIHLDFENKSQIEAIFLQNNLNILNEKNQQFMDKNFSVPTLPGQTTKNEPLNKDQTPPWNVPSFTFPLICPLLKLPEYRKGMLYGLIVSTGGISNDISTESFKCLQKEINKDVLKELVEMLSIKEDRVLTPLLKTWDALIEDFSECDFDLAFMKDKIFRLIKNSVKMPKLFAGVSCLVGMLKFDSKLGLESMGHFLGHKFPKVRQLCAEKLGIQILGLDEEWFSESEELSDWLMEMDWAADLDQKALEEIQENWKEWVQKIKA